MNKYPSGYALVSLISVFGWIVIVVSIIGGLVMLASAPVGMRYIGWTIAIAGSVQGLLLSGMGAIGLAILDGSIAQQEISANKVSTPHHEDDGLMRYLVSAAVGIPGGEFIENYKGKFLIRDASGNIIVGKESFASIKAAKVKIDSTEVVTVAAAVAPEEMAFDADGALLFKGYRIPRRGNEFLLNGQEYSSPQAVAQKILGATSSEISRYKIWC